MPRFLFTVIFANLAAWILLLLFASKTGGANIFQDLIFIILLFLASSLTIALIFYFARAVITKFTSRGKLKWEETEFVDTRPVFRRSFKMATVISAFIAVLAFLQLQQLLSLFNLVLLIAIIILGAIYFAK